MPGSAPVAADLAMAPAASLAIGKIPTEVSDARLRVQATGRWKGEPNGAPVAAFWAVAEVANRVSGADLDIQLVGGSGDVLVQAKGNIPSGASSTVVALKAPPSIPPGEYTVRVRSQTSDGSESMSTSVVLAAPPNASGAVFVRRGPTTGNREMPTADLRFRRNERLRVEVPSPANVTSARLLDRTGKPMPAIPVTANSRRDPGGAQWISGELQLAPLAPGDYIVEMVAGDVRTLAAFRVVL
jgi:hypothetical protein